MVSTDKAADQTELIRIANELVLKNPPLPLVKRPDAFPLIRALDDALHRLHVGE